MSKKLGLKFSEVMSGGFSLGVRDPEMGEQQGNRQGSVLTLRCEVAIDELESFVRDPQHAGKLSGTVDFAPLGNSPQSDSGVFNLFRPADTPLERWMVYDLAFVAQDKPYYLAGKKRVRHAHETEVLQETTTLYTLLHEGHDSSGAVVGAGVLHLGLKSLAELAKNMQVTNAQNSFEVMQGLGMYLKLFLGELWQTYF